MQGVMMRRARATVYDNAHGQREASASGTVSRSSSSVHAFVTCIKSNAGRVAVTNLALASVQIAQSRGALLMAEASAISSLGLATVTLIVATVEAAAV
jgi:hypothetical protein